VAIKKQSNDNQTSALSSRSSHQIQDGVRLRGITVPLPLSGRADEVIE
jgi:hypothetical protein